MLASVAVLTIGTGLLASLLLVVERVLRPNEDSVVDRIEMSLPRIQCGQCGYPGCRPYAEAIARDAAPINLCPPGGIATVKRLAQLLDREVEPVPDELGHASLNRVAIIDESACIGCGLCRPACPVDAILGVAQMMHTVVTSDCTGCERCLSPCPVDCIAMVPRHA